MPVGARKLPRVEASPIAPDEIPAFLDALYQAFHGQLHPDDLAIVEPLVEPERTLAFRDGGRMVATAGIFSRRLTVPGGEVPVAAVTHVGVLASHRRRGLLTSLMRRQLADVHEAGTEPVAALWASESAIYGRFGYGMATTGAEIDVAVPAARLRHAPDVRARLGVPGEEEPALAEIYDAARRQCPGMLDRSAVWWRRRTSDPEHRREGAGPMRAAVIDGAAYALYGVETRFGPSGPEGRVAVREVVAATPEGHAAIWAFLLALDLTRRVVYDLGASDDPLQHMVTESRAVQMNVGEALWLRVVDLPAALMARSYAAPFEVVLEVADEVCRWNAGRWALTWDGSAATCETTSRPADLELSAADVGAAYLGGPSLAVLARARRVRELRPGALTTAALAFRGERAPWCPETF
jgi:predicted acetyltransferase